ncbi:hypothetical protein KJ937_00090 [Patescibacteria group bacterium]|nr:hypothetical protein [Patescibacteria group bacterium]
MQRFLSSSFAALAMTNDVIISSMGNLFEFFNSFGWNIPSWDLAILLIFIIGALFYGLSLGRERILTILISTYLSFAVVTGAPLLNQQAPTLTPDENALIHLVLFLAILGILFFFFSRNRMIRRVKKYGLSNLWQTILFSLLQVGLIITITLQLLPAQRTDALTQITKVIFMSTRGTTLWMLLPIIFLVITSLKRHREYE